MKREKYQRTPYGMVVDDIRGGWPHGYYLPSPLPRVVDLSSETQAQVDRAQLALGRLAGVSMLLPRPDILLGPTVAKEAVSSSRIEGTQASLRGVLTARVGSGDPPTDDVREVLNYLSAMEAGVTLLEKLPIASRLVCEVHRVLMEGVRGAGTYPGEFRRLPVWVGEPGAGPASARFIPPLPHHLPELFTDWENYVNKEANVSVVVKAALMHYQFETLHPFLDGNGRVGRLLVVLLMMSEGLFTHPVLSLSATIEAHRSEYYERLQAVREGGELDSWVGFFARMVQIEADAVTRRLDRLARLRADYIERVGPRRQSMVRLVDILFSTVIVRVRLIQDLLGVSQPTSAKLMRQAEEMGWLIPLTRRGRGGTQVWVAHEVWSETTTESAEESP